MALVSARKGVRVDIRVVPTEIEGALVIEMVDVFRDDRGFFLESYHRRRYAEHGLPFEFVQDNHSRSSRGVVRGLHYQDMTEPMGKLMRCTRGTIWAVAADLRVGSPTFGRWTAAELSEENMRQFYVPVGCGAGFAALSETADVQYKCSGFYLPEAEGAVRWNDPDIGVAWPIAEPTLSKRDEGNPTLQEYLRAPAFRYGETG